MLFGKMYDSPYLCVPVSFSFISLLLYLSCSSLNVDRKVNKEPHDVHHEATAAENSCQHSGELC